jgi:hypothetical protein
LHCLSDPASDCYLWLRRHSPWPLTLLMRAGGALALPLGFGPVYVLGDGGYFTAHFYLHSPFTSPYIPFLTPPLMPHYTSPLISPSPITPPPNFPYLLTLPDTSLFASLFTSLFTPHHTPPFSPPFAPPLMQPFSPPPKSLFTPPFSPPSTSPFTVPLLPPPRCHPSSHLISHL